MTMGTNTIDTSSSKVRRSISCYSLPTFGILNPHQTGIAGADGTDSTTGDPIDEILTQESEERREMYEALRLKQETLEDALQQKLAELKALCLREAEITGELPPETPLHPNEPLPVIRRRVRTEFTLSDKLLTEPKSQEEEELSKLELEFAIQSKIVAATLKLMNEVNIRKAIRKQRKANYEQAVSKLNHLEQKLLPIRKKLEETRKTRNKKIKAKKQLIQDLNNDNGLHYPNGVMISHNHPCLPPSEPYPIPESNSHHKNKSRRRQPIVMSVSNSVPSSPVLTREFRSEPLSPPVFDVNNFIPISPAKRRLMRNQANVQQRPTSAITTKSGDEVDFGLPPPKPPSIHHMPSKSEPDTTSIHSNGSLYIHQNNHHIPSHPVKAAPETPPSILKNAKSTRTPPKKGVTIDERVIMNGEIKYRPFTPNFCGSSSERNIPEEFQHPTGGRSRKYSADINHSHHDQRSGSPVSEVFTPSDTDLILSRTNSLENTRRKSYVSAVQSPPSTPSSSAKHHQHYYNHHPSGSLIHKPIPKNPPPPVPESPGQKQRPLPPPPLPPVPLFDGDDVDDSALNVDVIQDGMDQVSLCSSSGGYGRETPRPVSIPLSPSVTGPSVEVVSVGQYTPYWEETKPFEMSDFYKYSAKHRNKQKQQQDTNDNSDTTAPAATNI